MWNAWLIGFQFVRSHHVRHHAEQGMQAVEIKIHAGAEQQRSRLAILVAHLRVGRAVDVLADFLELVAMDRPGLRTGFAGQHMGLTARQKHRIAGIELHPLAGGLLQPAALAADEMKPRPGLSRELDTPRLLHFAAAIFDTIEAQAAQYVCQRVAGDRNFGRTVKHNGVSSMETPARHSLCCSAA